MGSDSLRLIRYDLALFVRDLTDDATMAHYRSKVLSGELTGHRLSTAQEPAMSQEMTRRHSAEGSEFICNLKADLIYSLCLLEGEVPYPNPPLDAFEPNEWEELQTYCDLTGLAEDNSFEILTWEMGKKLLQSFTSNRLTNPYFDEALAVEIEKLIEQCRQDPALRIAYMNDF